MSYRSLRSGVISRRSEQFNRREKRYAFKLESPASGPKNHSLATESSLHHILYPQRIVWLQYRIINVLLACHI